MVPEDDLIVRNTKHKKISLCNYLQCLYIAVYFVNKGPAISVLKCYTFMTTCDKISTGPQFIYLYEISRNISNWLSTWTHIYKECTEHTCNLLLQNCNK